MPTLNPYLNFGGNTEDAFNFYKSVFGGEFTSLIRFKDTPEGGKVPSHEQEKIMHIALPIGKGNVLMATDALESMGQKISAGNNFHISVSTDSDAETTKIFEGLSAGGKVTIPLGKMFWGSFFGMCTDKYGMQWMVSNNDNQSN